jgi:uncharacterized Zn-binding protein involved in type VI secretion
MSKPAARLTDMHVCPMITVLVPHAGGPIAFPGEPRVLIGGLPAARVGDFCVCVGPPDVIAMGSFTVLIGGKPAARMGDLTAHGGTIVAGYPQVLIGDAGGGAGTPAAFTMSKARAEGAAFTQTNCGSAGVMEQVKDSPLLQTGDPLKKSWVEIELVDQKGKPVPHERYRVVPPGGKPTEGFLDDKGFARIGGIDPGTCVISFPDLDAASWKPEKGPPGRRSPPPPVLLRKPRVQPGSATVVLLGRPGVQRATALVKLLKKPGVNLASAAVRSTPAPGEPHG